MSQSFQPWSELPVNLADPVNRQHLLNRGRVGWWLTLPGWYGGPTWYDLMGQYHGTLSSGAAWGSPRRPGGFGTTELNASYVTVGSYAAFQSTTAISLAVWATVSSNAPGFYAVVADQTWASTHTSPYHSYKIGANSAGNGAWNAEYKTAGGAGTSVAGPSYTLGVPTRLLFTIDETNLVANFYINGVLYTSESGGQVNLEYGSGSKFMIGANADGAETFNGYVDDVSAWNRALSAAEVLADYDLSRRGYPGVLNRIDAALWMVAPAAAPTVFFPWPVYPEIPRRRTDPLDVIAY